MRYFALTSSLPQDPRASNIERYLEVAADHERFVPCYAWRNDGAFCAAVHPLASSICAWSNAMPRGDAIAISENLARRLHPALFEQLETPYIAPNAAMVA